MTPAQYLINSAFFDRFRARGLKTTDIDPDATNWAPGEAEEWGTDYFSRRVLARP